MTEGENCDRCNQLAGQVFPISDARVGKNCAPLHPNCNCQIGVLDSAGQIAYVISEGKTKESTEKKNWYDAFLRLPQDAKNLFLEFVRMQKERLKSKDAAGFLDWLTLGTISGTWQGYQERWQTLLEEPTLYNVVNYLSSGFADTVKGAVNPEDTLSLQHWLDSLELASMAFGAHRARTNTKVLPSIKTVTPSTEKTTRVIAETETIRENTDFGKIGKLVDNPKIQVDWSRITTHGIERMSQRNITQSMVDSWVKNGIVLQQSSGNYIYINKSGVVVLSPSGRVITAYTNLQFDENMKEIIVQLFEK